MADKRSNEKMDALRERLYSRGEAPRRHTRLDIQADNLSKTASEPTSSPVVPPPRPPVPPVFVPPPEPASNAPATHRWRRILILSGLAFFVLSIVVSSVYLLLGRNSVSGDNISLSLSGPFTIGGGEMMSLQVGITNNNNIPVESATLVLEYPPGTRSSDGEGKELFSERIPLSAIKPGETLNQTFQVRVFGEENQESTVRATVEYRVEGSNATFVKQAEPLKFKIGSAPIVINVTAEKTLSSGQETTITLELRSNSPLPLNDLLIKAEYPSGFDYTKSDPAPVSGRNIWSIKELKSESTATIKITGVVIGTESEKRVLKFAAGVASSRDSNNLASVLAVSETEFTVEAPFLASKVTIDGSESETVSVAPGAQANVILEFENNSNSPVYDGTVEVSLSGNALSDSTIQATGGHYDSNSKTVRWDGSGETSLRKLDPGESARMSFTLRPETAGLQTPGISFSVRATGRRVSESEAREEIAGTIKRTIKIESQPTLSATLTRAGGDSGPVPPVVGQNTSYTVVWKANSSANNLSGVTVTASLPAYVTWTGVTGGDGQWSYNPTSRIVEWRAGEIASGREASGTFQISLLPSASQIDRTPNIVGDSHLRADDSFTRTVLRASSGSLTTELAGDRQSGIVKGN